MSALAIHRSSARSRAVRISLFLAIVLSALAAFFTARALAFTSTNCSVNASGGYINCLSYTAPTYEEVKANHLAGTPYAWTVYRASDGARWGPWSVGSGDLNYHAVGLNLSGLITIQIDNQGTANPASYYVEMG